MDKLMIYPDGTDKPGVVFDVADGFVSRVVSAVAERNLPDARRVAKLLNELADDISSGGRRARIENLCAESIAQDIEE
jgi:hypothetical protein